MHRLIATSLLGAALITTTSSLLAQQEAQLRVGDNVEIKVSGVPPTEMAGFGVFPIANDGTINVPHLDRPVPAAGLTASQLQKNLEVLYVQQQIYTKPTFVVSTQGTIRFVNVSGAVRNEGRFPWTPDMTLLTAINAAGGFNDFANHKNVRLMRGDTVTQHNVAKIRANPTLDVPVKPGDTIMVQQRLF
jgi:polysaccharide export outer membrane protein